MPPECARRRYYELPDGSAKRAVFAEVYFPLMILPDSLSAHVAARMFTIARPRCAAVRQQSATIKTAAFSPVFADIQRYFEAGCRCAAADADISAFRLPSFTFDIAATA